MTIEQIGGKPCLWCKPANSGKTLEMGHNS